MQTHKPRTALEAVAGRRFVLTGWPWRSLAWCLATPPLALVTALPMAALGAPWIVLVAWVDDRIYPQPLGTAAFLAVLGAVLIAGLGPLVAMPLAGLERRRLRLVDTRPVASGHRPPPDVGVWSWLRTRYAEAATWRELAYSCLTATAVPVLSVVSTIVLLLIPGMVVSPLMVSLGGGPVALGPTQLTTVSEALPLGLAGLVLLPAVPYLLAVLAGAHAAVARALLGGGDSEALRVQLVEVSRSRARLVGAFEAERRRIERDLHDGAQRRLVSLTLQLGLARLDVPPDSPAAAAVTGAHEQAKLLMAELRELIRGIHPRVLTDRGLPAALRELADDASVQATLSTDLPGRLPSHVEATAYFVVAEAFTNIAKHSGAANAGVTARQQDRQQEQILVVEVTDDGHGGADPGRGTGLTGLADRVAVAGGRMLLSSPPGGPTLLRVEIPWSPSQSDQPSE